MSDKKRLFLIDGFAIAYRGYFALINRPLTNSEGENISAVYIFAQYMLKIIREEKPDYIAVALDSPEPTFRHEQYEEYKATRDKMPDDMIPQVGWIEELIETLAIPVIRMPGFEADDIMGTLAREAEKKDVDTFLVTSDKDFMQLISDHIKMYKMVSSTKEVEIIDYAGVEKKFGVHPDHVTDVLGLMGDASDNVPGVPKIGEKTATKLIQEYGSMEELYEKLDTIKREVIRNTLTEHKEQAFLSKELVTIDIKVPLDFKLDDLKAKEPDPEQMRDFFERFEFKSLLKDLEAPSQPQVETENRSYQLIQNDREWNVFLAKLKKEKSFVLDTETTSLNPLESNIVGLSFSWKANEAYYLPVFENGKVDLEKLDKLKPFLEDPKIKKSGQNIKYDMLVLSQYGIEVKGIHFDTMIAAYLLNPSRRQNNLDALALEYLNYKKIPTTDLLGTGRNQITMDAVPVEQVCEYACEDADITGQLQTLFEKELKKNNLLDLFNDIEMPLMSVLYEMEKAGIGLDTAFLDKMGQELKIKLAESEKEILKLAGEEFNINSTQQLGKILFEKLEIHKEFGKKRAKKTKTGYSTDVSVLEEYKAHPLVAHLMEYRQMNKLKNTYVDALPKLVNPKTGRLHTSFNQTVAATGRLSSSDPNLQNIPFKTEMGRKIRKAFIPVDTNHVLLSADYSQVELRLMAALSGDGAMQRAFHNEEDIHRATAAAVLGIEAEEVSTELRNRAKSINFGIIYGMGQYGLARDAGITPGEAQEFIDAYFAKYPGVKIYMDQTIDQAHKEGYVKTLLGRIRYFPDLNSDNKRVVAFAENAAINTPLQGTAADLIKIAMVNLQKELVKKGLKSKIILQVHDELLLEVPKEEIDTVSKLVRNKMEKAIKLDVPLKVELQTGQNWLEAH